LSVFADYLSAQNNKPVLENTTKLNFPVLFVLVGTAASQTAEISEFFFCYGNHGEPRNYFAYSSCVAHTIPRSSSQPAPECMKALYFGLV